MSKEAELTGEAHACVRRLVLGVWWKVDPVKRGAMSMGRKLLGSVIPPHPYHRSRRSENPKVREQRYFSFVSDDPPGNIDNSAIPDQVQGTLSSDKNKPNTTDENESGQWKSAASATVKLFLRGTKDSADVFPPLKSVVGCLCYILENCEVLQPSSI